MDKGSLHLYIVSTKAIEKNQEILLSPDAKNGILPTLSIQDELRQIKKINGLIDEKKSRKTVNAKRRLKRETVKKELCESSSEDDMPVSIRKTRSNAFFDKHEKSVNFNLKTEEIKPEIKFKKESTPIPKDVVKKESNDDTKAEKRVEVKEQTITKAEPSSSDKLKELKIEIKDEKVEVPALVSKGSTQEVANPIETPNSPEAGAASTPAKSPGKPVLGLPDQSGLIIGVNTINYDAGLRKKSKTREEKKTSMILKASEDMEKAELLTKLASAGISDEASTKPFSCPNCPRMFSGIRGFEPHLKKCSLSTATGEK